MNLAIPGLSDALDRLEATEAQMTEMATALGEVVTLMREQNDMIQKLVDAL